MPYVALIQRQNRVAFSFSNCKDYMIRFVNLKFSLLTVIPFSPY